LINNATPSIFPIFFDKAPRFHLTYHVNVLQYGRYEFVQRNPDYKFSMTATAEDLGKAPEKTVIDLDIRVVESHKKAPAFLPRSTEPIKLQENFSDFDASIVRLKAVSNIDNSSNSDNSYLLFELVTGRTEQTNKGNTFRYELRLLFFIPYNVKSND